MTKFVRISCLFLLVCLLFPGCAATQKEQTVACGEVILTFPASYIDLSDREYSLSFPLVYGVENEAVLAISEEKAALEAYYPDINAEKYAMLFVETNKLESQVGKLGELVTFTYEKIAEDTPLTYLCGVYEGRESFWCVQFYCPTEEFAEQQERFMGYLQKVQIQEVLTN